VPESVGQLLRGWRLRRKLSQLDLANLAEVSTRHISFVETGRTNPSGAMVVRLADCLGVPLRERNRLLVAAGHAPVYRERAVDDPDFVRVREALERVLRAHEPYPAVAVDRRWNVLLANGSFDLKFELYDAAADGNLIGVAIELPAQNITGGLMSAELDFGGPLVFDVF